MEIPICRKEPDCTLSPWTIESASQTEAFLTIDRITRRGSVADGFSWHKHMSALHKSSKECYRPSLISPLCRFCWPTDNATPGPRCRKADGVEILTIMTRRKTAKTKDKMQNRCTSGLIEVKTVTPEYGMGGICFSNAGEHTRSLVKTIAVISLRWEATPEGWQPQTKHVSCVLMEKNA